MFSKTSLGSAVVLAALLGSPAAAAPALTLGVARHALASASVETRRAGALRLGEAGTMADAQRLVPRLADDDAVVRAIATAAIWQIWSRSGDPAIDALFKRGIEEIEGTRLQDALATFTEIIRRKPSFAEGWNKRATIYYLLGRHAESLKDCAEVIKRNPIHFGALSGYAQIYAAQGEPERALVWYRRALQVNPNLPGAEETIELLEEQVAAKRRHTT